MISTAQPKVGREYQHLEDLVFVHGSQGAIAAAEILETFTKDVSDVTVKFDGNPTVYWGREPNGEFVFTGKNGWNKCKSTTAEQLADFIKQSGSQESWRAQFADHMAVLFRIVESATPIDFRGYIYGDVLYHPGRRFEINNNCIQFTPNAVTYHVDGESRLADRIAESAAGIASHARYEYFGSKHSVPIENVQCFNSTDLVVLDQITARHPLCIDLNAVEMIKQTAEDHADCIDSFLQPQTGLSDIKNIIYRYVNHSSRNHQLDQLELGFFDWVNKTDRISKPKKLKIHNKHKNNPHALHLILGLTKQVMQLKDRVIDQLDQSHSDIRATVDTQQGGEGYIALRSKTKLVPRSRWQPQ
jgi:hypothetical protein